MTDFNLFILTIYFLCVTYVLFQMVNSFNDEYTVKLEKSELDEELKLLRLADRLEISFKFDNRYEINHDRNKLKQLAITIKNKSDQFPVYVDWDSSAMTDWFGDRVCRITRIVPGSRLDLSQEQVYSIITRGRTLQENIALEDTLARKGEKEEIEVIKPLLDLSEPRAPEAKKKAYKAFMSGEAPLFFYLDLELRVVDKETPRTGDRTRVRCKFCLNRLPWQSGLPWNPKK
jgi:hypothetical protein